MNAQEKERRINNIRLRAVILKSLVVNLKENGGIDMRQEMINFFNDIPKKYHEDWDKLREHYAEEKGTIEKTRRELGIKKRR